MEREYLHGAVAWRLGWLLLGVVLAGPTMAGTIGVAVASNFVQPMAALVAEFEAQTGHRVRVSSGSTGKLYAQIVNGAPFDVFLAANAREPERLVATGMAVAKSRRTYARGRLALWANGAEIDPRNVGERVCNAPRLAIANPRTAPYGSAAFEVLQALGCVDTVRSHLVRGENIAQTYQFVATGNVPLGFIARSQLRGEAAGRFWLVPEWMHSPIEQQVVLLSHGASSALAQAFVDFLGREPAKELIRGFGYDISP